MEDWRKASEDRARAAIERIYGVQIASFGPDTWSAYTPRGILVTDSLALLIGDLERDGPSVTDPASWSIKPPPRNLLIANPAGEWSRPLSDDELKAITA